MDEQKRTRTTRTWPQRFTIAATAVVSLVALLAGVALFTGRWVLAQRQFVVIVPADDVSATADGLPLANDVDDDLVNPADLIVEPAIEVVAGDIEPGARNFLLVGTDNNACIEPDSPYAPVLLGRENFGERADVIQIWRVNTDTGAVAALSFPRDLYVSISGGRRGRINASFDSTNPTALISTIQSNFGIEIDHYVQVDFCAFKRLVDSVDGVAIPFTYPTRDRGTGLSIATTGCTTLTGDDALAYVRSRKLEFERPAGSDNWVIDPSSDWGRIARQQDFIRRTLAKVISAGLYSPSVANGLIQANASDVVTDSELSMNQMLAFANVLRSVNTLEIGSYQVEAVGRIVSGQAVLIPTLQGDAMRSILDIFQGDSTIEGSPVNLADIDTTTTTLGAENNANIPNPAGELTPLRLLPRQSSPDDNTIGWVPDAAITCN